MKVQRIEGAPLASLFVHVVRPTPRTPSSLRLAQSSADWVTTQQRDRVHVGRARVLEGERHARQPCGGMGADQHPITDDATPNVQVDDVVVTTQVYGFPRDASQKSGPTPLADVAPDASPESPGMVRREHENLIAGNDDRMEDAVWANGRLWGALKRSSRRRTAPSQVGSCVLRAHSDGRGVWPRGGDACKARLRDRNGASVLFPSIAMNNVRARARSCSPCPGQGYYPSAGYARL